MNGNVDLILKHSFLYSFALSHPLAIYMDAYPSLQNTLLIEAEQLAFGEHSHVVRVLQEKLNKLSYYGDEVDGDFGILTEYALKNFQLKNQITITGQTDKKTIQAIIKAEKESYIKQLEKLSEKVYPGMHNDDVKIVQEALEYFGYYVGEIDGIYGPLTGEALKIAEEEHNIKLTNGVTQSSLTQLYEADDLVQTPPIEDKQEKIEVNNSETITSEIKVAKKEKQPQRELIEVAKSFIGTPYVWGGDSPSGFDCSGFIQFVYDTQGITIPRTVNDTWNFAESIETASIGDLVFFETYKPGPSHAGIYIGDGKFIHAGSSQGVEISDMDINYWKQRYLGAKRIQ